ncbi:hypothetical protein AXF42_Ash013269 [Apostasia shenzhenica]|uniref:Transposase (putative) gypsy type domain-containing protein n=1 Tax=Apostasia shenzhenica TaxID=1088818 RepID=A0A2I0BBH6_9ASPA|nr:hypothetical protein AXF42_Ash013269 [Apostasia shenzhenica]
MGGREIEWARLAEQFQKDTSYQESLMMEHEVLNATKGFRGNPLLMVIPPTADLRPNNPPQGAVCVYRAQVEYGLMMPSQTEFKEVLNSFQLVPAQLSPNAVTYMYSFLKLLQARGIAWSLTLFRNLFSWIMVPGYRGCLALRSRTRKAMFSGASSSHSDWRDFYFFVGGDLGIPLTLEFALPSSSETSKKEIVVFLKWKEAEIPGSILFLASEKYIAKSQGYTIFKEVVPPPGTVLMRRARRGQPPTVQLSKQVVGVEGEEEAEVPKPVCGGIPIDVVSSPDDSGDDKKTLAKVMEKAGKGKELASLEKERVEVPRPGEETTVTSCQALVPSKAFRKRRSPPDGNSPEPPSKKGKSVGEREDVGEWEKSTEPPLCINFTGEFAGAGTKVTVSATEVERKMTVVSQQTSSQFNPV